MTTTSTHHDTELRPAPDTHRHVQRAATLDELAAATARECERVKADYDTFVTSTLTMEWGLSAEEIWRRVEQALEEQAGE